MFVNDGITQLDDWDVEGFFRSRVKGFLGAVQIYNTPRFNDIGVLFKSGRAFMVYNDSEGRPENLYELKVKMKKCLDADVEIEDEYEDVIVELCDGFEVEDSLAEYYGFSEEDCEDIVKRVNDINLYYAVGEED